MKKARMNISHSRFILSKLKIFGEIVTTLKISGRTSVELKSGLRVRGDPSQSGPPKI